MRLSSPKKTASMAKRMPLSVALLRARRNCQHWNYPSLMLPLWIQGRYSIQGKALSRLRLAAFDPPRWSAQPQRGIERDAARRRRSLWQTRPRHGWGGTRADEEDEEEAKSKKGPPPIIPGLGGRRRRARLRSARLARLGLGPHIDPPSAPRRHADAGKAMEP